MNELLDLLFEKAGESLNDRIEKLKGSTTKIVSSTYDNTEACLKMHNLMLHYYSALNVLGAEYTKQLEDLKSKINNIDFESANFDEFPTIVNEFKTNMVPVFGHALIDIGLLGNSYAKALPSIAVRELEQTEDLSHVVVYCTKYLRSIKTEIKTLITTFGGEDDFETEIDRYIADSNIVKNTKKEDA